MKKIILGVVGVAAVGLAGFVAVVSMQPAVTEVERSLVMEAAPADVYPLLSDYKSFVTWSPWSELDPDQTTEFSDPSAGVGAWYTWEGNDDVGKGRMETTAAVENQSMTQDLAFIEPFESTAEVTYTLSPEGEGTKVTWAFSSPNNFVSKAMGLFLDMDAMLGSDFEKGLAKLQPLAEKAAQDRIAQEKAAEEAAKAEAEAAEGEEGEATEGEEPSEG